MIKDTVKISDDDDNIKLLKSTLDEMSDLLDIFLDNASHQIQIELNGNKTYLLQGQTINAAQHTLSSIWGCSRRACFSDAFTLVRKFRDDLIQYLFIIFTLNRVQGLTEEESKYYIGEGTDIDRIIEGLNRFADTISSGRKKKAEEKAVDSWLENTLSEDDHAKDRKQYFDASKYISILKTDKTIENCFYLHLQKLWSTIDRRLNNYVHTNGSKYIMANLPCCIYGRRKDMLIQLHSTLRDIMAIFVSLLVLIKPTYIQSCDYTDYLDIGETPPEGSQYWIASTVQHFIDTDIVRVSSSLKQFLNENNPFCMQIK